MVYIHCCPSIFHLWSSSWEHLFSTVGARDKARLLCIQHSFQSTWLNVYPTPALGLQFLPSEFVILVKWWFGVPLFNIEEVLPCRLCGESAFGSHTLCCKKGGISRRHAEIVDFIRHLVSASGLHCTLEESVGGTERPGDIFIPQWQQGKSLQSTSPWCTRLRFPTIWPTCAMIRRKSLTQSNLPVIRLLCEAAGVLFTPLAITTFGAIGPVFFFELEQRYFADTTTDDERKCA